MVKGERSARDAEVQELKDEARQKRYGWLMRKAAIYGCVWMAILFGGNPPSQFLGYMFLGPPVETAATCLCSAICVLFFDGWVPLWLADLWLVGFSVVQHVHLFITLESDAAWGIIRNAQFYSIFAVVMIGNVRVTAAMVLSHIIIVASGPNVRSGYLGVIDVFRVTDGFLIIMLTGFFISQWLWNEAEARVGEMEANMTKATTQDLLDVMCDATVLLDEKLMLLSPSSRLDALLLRTAPKPESRNFKDFLSGDNVARFTDFVDNTSLVGKASTLHLDLTDSMGGAVAAQIFHVTAHDPFTKELTHLIGVQEDEGFKRNTPEAPSSESQISPLREQARDEVDQGSIASIHSWSSELDLSYVILTCDLVLNAVHESDQSRAIFGFTSMREPIATRFRESEVLMEWLRNIHMRCSASSEEHPTASCREHLGEAAVEVPSTGLCHKVDVWCSYRKVWIGENRGSMVTSLTLHLLPLDTKKKKKKKRRRAELHLHVPQRESSSDVGSSLSNEL